MNDNNWRAASMWQQTESGYQTARLAFGNLAFGDFTYKDYTLEFDVTFQEFTKWGSLRVMLRQNGQFDCYALTINRSGIEFMRMDGRWDIGRKYGVFEKRIEKDRSYSFKAVVKDNSIEVYWDGERIFSQSDLEDRYFTGAIVLRAELALFTLADLKVTELTKIPPKEAKRRIWEKAKTINPAPEIPKPWKTVQQVGFNNMLLIYSGLYPQGEGKWQSSDALSVTGYLDEDGIIKDRMFDAYLFLAIASKYGRSFEYTTTQENAGKKEDWDWYLDRLFDKERQLEVFDRSVSEVNNALGDFVKNKVVIMIPNPHPLQNDFGKVDGENLSFSAEDLDMEKAYQNRLKAILWYVDEVCGRFKESKFQNLELLGFYWMKEETESKQDERLVQTVAQILHLRGYKWYWIPYYKAMGYDKELGFDCVFCQPNYMFQDEISIARFWNIYVDAKRHGFNLELEGENSIFESPQKRERFLTYLKAGVTLGFQDSPKAYYFGTKALPRASKSQDPQLREVYDSLYKFICKKYEKPLF